MTGELRLDDPRLVEREYADDTRLRRRASIYSGGDARDPALRAVREAKPTRVLEVGCGWGELAERIARETGAQVVAVDISPHMVALARERGVDARVADVQRLPFEGAEFDVVVAAWMLYHVPDLRSGLAEIARVLRPGGRLVAITNSSRHLRELRDLVGSGPSPISFTRESGAELLATTFTNIARHDSDDLVVFPDRDAVEEYVLSSIAMSPFAANLPSRIDEPFRATRATSAFVAEKRT